MRRFLLFPLVFALACNHTPENPTSSPPTDHAVYISENEPEAPDTVAEVAVTLQADTTDLAPEPDSPIKLMLEGAFHKQEVWKGAEHKPWLAVFNENGRFYLRQTTMRVQPAFDPIVDFEVVVNGVQLVSGREVTSPDSNVVFFLTGLERYTTGEIDTVHFSKSIIPANKALTYTFKGKNYSIAAHGDSSATQGYRNYGWKVTGQRHGRSITQLLAEHEYFDDSIYTLLWAGDLDRDGIPDLLLDLSNHYNVSTVTLFLSSKAEKGKLYKKVAVFETVGC